MSADVPQSSSSSAAEAVVRRLRDAGHVAFFAGGCVRDMLLGTDPSDYDVATSAEPTTVSTLFANTQAVGASFGVILVRLSAEMIEVATFRTDGKYRDGRRPESVVFSTPGEDANRRDFTVNGMFYDPIDRRIIDYVGGQDDLRTRTLRAIGNPDERFAEDQLRLLRAVRFAARFDLSIEPATAEAIVRHASALPRISPERIADELRRMLTAVTRVAAVAYLRSLGLLPILLRLLSGPVADHGLLGALSSTTPGEISFGLALATVLLDTRPAASESDLHAWLESAGIRRATQAMRQSLKISNDELDDMAYSMDVGHLLQAEFPRMATLKRFIGRRLSADAIRLLRALRAAGYFVERVTRLVEQFDRLATEDVAPPPLVTGDDLTAAGATPGPAYKRALDEAYDEQLEGRLDSKPAALAFALRAMQP